MAEDSIVTQVDYRQGTYGYGYGIAAFAVRNIADGDVISAGRIHGPGLRCRTVVPEISLARVTCAVSFMAQSSGTAMVNRFFLNAVNLGFIGFYCGQTNLRFVREQHTYMKMLRCPVKSSYGLARTRRNYSGCSWPLRVYTNHLNRAKQQQRTNVMLPYIKPRSLLFFFQYRPCCLCFPPVFSFLVKPFPKGMPGIEKAVIVHAPYPVLIRNILCDTFIDRCGEDCRACHLMTIVRMTVGP